jgi:hypothetical protein
MASDGADRLGIHLAFGANELQVCVSGEVDRSVTNQRSNVRGPGCG